jgi:four helix bundle protein
MPEECSYYLERNKNVNRGFRKLEVWKEAISLFVFVRNTLKNLTDLPFKIKSQMLNSAFSVHSNIAEGYCRRSSKEYLNFINIALGSLGENYSQFYALLSSDDIHHKIFDEYDNRHYSLENKLLKLAKSITRKTKNKEWYTDYSVHENGVEYKKKRG